MAIVKIKYYRIKRNNMAYWMPTPAMKRAGFKCVSLGKAGPEAQAAAHALNAQWDEARRSNAHINVTEAVALSDIIYPPMTVGAAFQQYRRTQEWAKKPLRTREDWDRGWRYIKPIFAKQKFDDVTFEIIGLWRDKIEHDKSLQEAHRAMKIWRALWKVSAAMRYCRKDDDPSLAIKNKAPKGRKETWREGEVVRLVKEALRRGYDGLAVCVAILYDGSASPGDVRNIEAQQLCSDGHEIWFDYARGKTGREGVQTLSRRTQRLVSWYLRKHYGQSNIMPQVVLFRTRRGAAFTKNSFSEDFRDIRSIVLPSDKRQMRDMRRTGAVEAIAGGAQGPQLSAKMANNIGQSAKLESTYAPIQVEVARQVDAARRIGRRALEANTTRIKVGTHGKP